MLNLASKKSKRIVQELEGRLQSQQNVDVHKSYREK